MHLACRPSAAQSSASLSGYLEHQYGLDRLDRKWQHLDYDRLRVDLDAEAGRRTRASAGLIFQLYRGATTLDLADYLPASVDIPPDSLTVELTDRQFVNHAFISLRLGRLTFDAGKQYLTWGTGWAFNPTELFRPKNVLEPSYDREGVGAISAKVAVADLTDVTVALVPESSLQRSGKVLRARHHLQGFDLSALAATFYENPSSQARRSTLGADVSGELSGFGVWAESTLSRDGEDRWLEATLGGNHTLPDGSLLLAEVFYNGRGRRGPPYPRQAWLDRLAGNGRTLGRWTGYGFYTRDIGQLWRAGASVVAGLADGSAVFVPFLSYAFAQDVDLLLNGLLFVGDEGDEFGADRLGGFLRGRVYF